MARVTVEDALEKVTNRFALVIMVSKRVKQILKGSETTVPAKNNKMVVTALREIAAGNVGFPDHLNEFTQRNEVEAALNK